MNFLDRIYILPLSPIFYLERCRRNYVLKKYEKSISKLGGYKKKRIQLFQLDYLIQKEIKEFR